MWHSISTMVHHQETRTLRCGSSIHRSRRVRGCQSRKHRRTRADNDHGRLQFDHSSGSNQDLLALHESADLRVAQQACRMAGSTTLGRCRWLLIRQVALQLPQQQPPTQTLAPASTSTIAATSSEPHTAGSRSCSLPGSSMSATRRCGTRRHFRSSGRTALLR